MFRISLIEGIKNICKNKILTYLTVILFSFLFLLQGYTLTQHYVTELRNRVTENESFANYEMYKFQMTDIFYDIYLERDYKDEIRRETFEFVEALNNIEYLKFVCEYDCDLAVKDFQGDPKVFAKDYEAYKPDAGYVSVNALVVSPTFRECENYRVIKGRDFTDEDMIYVAGQPIPVLLGYKYYDLGVYEVGDRFSLDGEHFVYSDLVNEFEVIGFLEEDTTVIEKNGITVWDLDTFIISPAVTMSWDQYCTMGDEVKNGNRYKFAIQNFSFMMVLTKSKMFVDTEYSDEVLMNVQSALDEYCGVSRYFKLSNSRQVSMKNISRMESFTNYSTMITAMLTVFAVITVLISITNRVSRNVKDYTIHSVIGSTNKTAVLFMISEMSIILICSIVIGMFVTEWFVHYVYMPFYFWQSLGVYALTSVIILVLSAVITLISMRKYDVCTLIK